MNRRFDPQRAIGAAITFVTLAVIYFLTGRNFMAMFSIFILGLLVMAIIGIIYGIYKAMNDGNGTVRTLVFFGTLALAVGLTVLFTTTPAGYYITAWFFSLWSVRGWLSVSVLIVGVVFALTASKPRPARRRRTHIA